MKQVLIRRGVPIVRDLPAPQLTDSTILVDTRFSLISTGTEVAGMAATEKPLWKQAFEDPGKVVRGLRMVRDSGFRKTMALVNHEVESAYPTGYSLSGVVVACGSNVQHFSAGDSVACAGAGRANHAERVLVPQNLAVRVPDACDLESAASATLGAIAMQGIRRADLRLGESVAVIGLGLIGQLTAQMARVSGCRVFGTDTDGPRITTALRLGMHQGANPADVDPVREALEFSAGRGVDAVLITAASSVPGLLQQAMQMVRKKGRVVLVGAVPLEMERSPFYEKEVDFLISCSYGPGRYDAEYEERGLDYPYAYVRWTENRNMAEYLRLIAGGQLDFRSLIGSIHPITEAPAAYDDVKQNRRIAVLLSYPEREASDKETSRVEISPARVAGPIRVAIVGPGSFVRAVHLPNLQQLAARFSVDGIVSRSGVTATNVAQQYKARFASTVLDDAIRDSAIDLILIGSRHDLHAKQTIQALEGGKHVLVEKPLALNDDELGRVLEAGRRSGKVLFVGFNRRFAPLVSRVRDLVSTRSSPLVITYRMNAGTLPPDSWVHGEEGGGRIIGEACHVFDLFNYITGQLPVEVTAMPLISSAAHLRHSDNFTASVRYPDGSLCTLTYTSLGSADLPKERMEVFVDGKTIVLDDYLRLHFYGIAGKAPSELQQNKGHLEELIALADHLDGKRTSPLSLEEIEAATRTSFIVDDLVRNGPAET